MTAHPETIRLVGSAHTVSCPTAETPVTALEEKRRVLKRLACRKLAPPGVFRAVRRYRVSLTMEIERGSHRAGSGPEQRSNMSKTKPGGRPDPGTIEVIQVSSAKPGRKPLPWSMSRHARSRTLPSSSASAIAGSSCSSSPARCRSRPPPRRPRNRSRNRDGRAGPAPAPGEVVLALWASPGRVDEVRKLVEQWGFQQRGAASPAASENCPRRSRTPRC